MKTPTAWVTACAMTLACCVAGCDKGEAPAPAPAATATYTEAELAVEADFEEEAEQQITTSNYKDEVASLEKELAAQ